MIMLPLGYFSHQTNHVNNYYYLSQIIIFLKEQIV